MGDFGGSACAAGDFAGKKDLAVEAGVERLVAAGVAALGRADET